MPGSLEGKVVLVTGAASGLGRATAIACFQAGARVAACDTSDRDHDIRILAGDVSDERSCRNLVEQCLTVFGRLDVLINNAGIMDKFDGVADCEMELWQRVIGVNLTGPFMLSKLAVRQFLEQGGGGNIVNVGSASSTRGATAGAAYTASKHGLLGLTRNTAANYMKKGVRCNIVLPGGMHTNIGVAMQQGVNEGGYDMLQKAAAVDAGLVDVKSIAKTIVHLASDASEGLNGAVIAADNGWSAF
ncbi:short-chain dehydrogenase/reductase SDR [Saccharata proteae CBS 121410]|uniref:Short-chain dehydrogenase/reductase SDR n=1 Tax=Saccharata proteae CBS 121410 TaxID=1314787 RepID=A0A6A5YAR5_9PEZI|nr:short-chain dehydrogenase/reductase SDR [Saccharata proteae CBS 121410]